MESRKSNRFKVPDITEVVISNVFIEFDLDNSEIIKAGIFDISLGGLAIEVTGLTEAHKQKIDILDDFFIRLHIKNNMFLIGVEPAWKAFKKLENDYIFKGGYNFDLISEKDKLQLSDLIEELRSSEFLV